MVDITTFKMVICGGPSVGKTSLLQRARGSKFADKVAKTEAAKEVNIKLSP